MDQCRYIKQRNTHGKYFFRGQNPLPMSVVACFPTLALLLLVSQALLLVSQALLQPVLLVSRSRVGKKLRK